MLFRSARITGGSGASQINITNNITNSGVLGAVNDLTVSGATITNDHIINAGNNLTVNATNLTNNTTLFSGNNINLYTTNTLANNSGANIFAMGNMTLAANVAGGKTNKVVNTSAKIEALGNMSVNTVNLLNTSGTPTTKVVTTTSTQTNVCGLNCKDVITTTTDTLVQTSPTLTPATTAAINAGGNLTINAAGGTVTNEYGLLSAGGTVDITAATIDNKGISLTKTITVSTHSWRNSQTCSGTVIFGGCFTWDFWAGGWVGAGTTNTQVDAGTTTVPKIGRASCRERVCLYV